MLVGGSALLMVGEFDEFEVREEMTEDVVVSIVGVGGNLTGCCTASSSKFVSVTTLDIDFLVLEKDDGVEKRVKRRG
jgi:hypothetical protein